MLKLVLFAAFLGLIEAQELQGRCTTNSDCSADAACVTVDTGRSAFSKCTASQPLCEGLTFGHCPSTDSEVGPMMCVFVATDKIRNVECCTSTTGQTLIAAPDGSVVLSDTSGTSTVTTSTTTTTTSTKANSTSTTDVITKPTRLLQSSTCLNCYKTPSINKTIAGTFQCVQLGQCKTKSVFPAVCDTGVSCSTGKNEICSNHGTCTPTDSDAPEAKYRCLCDVGFGGRFCDQVLSNNCVADCGLGGTCVDVQHHLQSIGQCVCNKGYAGDQCFGCTSDTVCNSANKGNPPPSLPSPHPFLRQTNALALPVLVATFVKPPVSPPQQPTLAFSLILANPIAAPKVSAPTVFATASVNVSVQPAPPAKNQVHQPHLNPFAHFS
uniref:Secreted protein n=1 Tax=Thraustotheca clavata TaxID=74557 RepID=A0A0A7CMP6_9STRA|nr:secreted protein [Thraustotheca clavata]